ncbi:MAG: alpha/beta hydrolase [Clostridiales bacterium]|nr:alpha/beta hydrolase [Clostridiales bacterium]
MKKILKIIGKIIFVILILTVVFTAVTFIIHKVKTKKEIALLKEQGYYNPVSVGDYSINVSAFGNSDGKHTIVGIAGLGMADFPVAARQMTKEIEKDNLVVFVDRAGYGFSGDTNDDMTNEHIVSDYRTALKNAGYNPPYFLMVHSIGGAYANYWCSNYPEEIEGVVFVDGSQLSEDAFEDEPESDGKVGIIDRIEVFLAKLGFGRYVIRQFFYLYPDNYSDEEQYLGDALTLMEYEKIAGFSESNLLSQNAQEAFDTLVSTDMPKLYICASWGAQTIEDVLENDKWINRQIEKNKMNMKPRPEVYEGNEETVDKMLAQTQELRETVIKPYTEKMGNCEVVCLAGDHMIYEQRPEECGKIITDFIEKLDKAE